MKEQKLCRVKYDAERDAYRIEILDGITKEWALDIECKCQTTAKNPSDAPAFIHYSMLTELLSLLSMGYELAQ